MIALPSRPGIRPQISLVLAVGLAALFCCGATAPAAQGAEPAETNCNAPIPQLSPAGNRKFVVSLDPETIWQPRGGEVRVIITGAFPAETTPIVACFRWRNPQQDANPNSAPANPNAAPGANPNPASSPSWVQSAPPKMIKKDSNGATFAVTVPHLSAPLAPWHHRLTGSASGEYTGLFYVIPVSNLRIMAGSADPLDIVLPVGITSTLLSSLIAIGSVLFAGFVLWRVGIWWGIPGRNPILKIISTRAGYASLSQLQIILWTLVIGAGAAYVMALSGNLIDIKEGALWLLGITGAATLGSRLQSQQQNQQQSQQAQQSAPVAPAPSAQIGVPMLNGGLGQTDVQFSWTPAAGGGQPTSYTVQYRPTGTANWIVASNRLSTPRIMIVGLAPNTEYEFQVAGVNGAAMGPFSPSLTVRTRAADPVPADAPAGVTGLTATTSTTDPTITLTWTPSAPPGPIPDPPPPLPLYTIRYRLHDSADPWAPGGTTYNPTFPRTGLVPDALYDFEVRPARGDVMGPAATVTAKSGPHVPGWADLVLDPDKGEIDVTRVQMLFFTLIVAVFVTLRVVTSGQIPDIPNSFLLGISNGVYLTAKFLPNK